MTVHKMAPVLISVALLCMHLKSTDFNEILPKASHSSSVHCVVQMLISASKYFGSCSLMLIFCFSAARQKVPSTKM